MTDVQYQAIIATMYDTNAQIGAVGVLHAQVVNWLEVVALLLLAVCFLLALNNPRKSG